MFGRKILDLVILSLLNDHPEGLSGYMLLKIFKEKFGTWNLSPGTLYPLLKKRLTEQGYITETNKENTVVYTITEQGKKRIEDMLPKALDNSIQSIPNLIQNLAPFLPFDMRSKFLCDIPHMQMHCFNCHSDGQDLDEISADLPTTMALKKLNAMKDHYLQTKQHIQEWSQEQITEIDKILKKIDEKIQNVENQKGQWKKIPIIDEEEEKDL